MYHGILMEHHDNNVLYISGYHYHWGLLGLEMMEIRKGQGQFGGTFQGESNMGDGSKAIIINRI